MRTAVMEIGGNGPPTTITLHWAWQPLGEDLMMWKTLPGYFGKVATGTWTVPWLIGKVNFYDYNDDLVARALNMDQISSVGYPFSDMAGLSGELIVLRPGGRLYSGRDHAYWKLISV